MDFHNFDPQKIIVISNFVLGRASSVFFLGLLDGHPEIVTLPYLTLSYRSLDFKGLDPTVIAEAHWRLLEYSYARISGGERPPYDHLHFVAHVSAYLAHFGVNRTTVFVSMFFGYATVSSKDASRIRYINHNEHEYRGELQMQREFQNVKTIFLLRDPRASFASIKRVGNLNPIECEMLFSTLYNRYYRKLRALNQRDVLLIKHEDIHLNYPSAKSRLCDFLSIPDHPALGYSSFFGIPYTGKDSTYKSTMQLHLSKPDPRYVNDDWKAQLSRSEFRFVQWMSASIIAEQGYADVQPSDLKGYAPTFDYFEYFAGRAQKGSVRQRLLRALGRTPVLGPVAAFGIRIGLIAAVYVVVRLGLLIHGCGVFFALRR